MFSKDMLKKKIIKFEAFSLTKILLTWNIGATGLGRHFVFQLHGSSSAVEGVFSSRKRARKDDPGGVALFDLNMPAI